MKIAIINPPYFEVYKGYEKAAQIGACWPPMGLRYLAGMLRARGHEPVIFDAGVENLNNEHLMEAISAFRPAMAALTATTPTFHKACGIAVNIKNRFGIPVVIGGIHATIMRENVLNNHPEFDFAVIGEGEATVAELAQCLEEKGDPAKVAGILFRQDGAIRASAPRPLAQNLDELPFPAHDSNKDLYLWLPPGKGVVPITAILTKRGCPFNCTFCSQHSMFGRNVRYRSVGNVLDELEYIVRGQGMEHVIFLDDTLVLDKQRMLAICAGIKKRGLKFTWEGMTRANLIDKETIDTMAEAGLTRMSFGIESGNQEILDRIEKGVTLAQIRQAYRWAKEAGIETRGSAILGNPGETSATAWETIKFLRSLKDLDQVYLNIMVPYPGTEVFELARHGKAGYKLLSEDFEHYIRYNRSVLEVNDLDREKLRKLQNIGLWLFYLTPRRIWHNLRRSGLKNGFRMAEAMLKSLLSKPPIND